MVLKVIVSSSSLLTAKYGARTGDVRNAVDFLIQADQQRGLDSRLILLDVEMDSAPTGCKEPDQR